MDFPVQRQLFSPLPGDITRLVVTVERKEMEKISKVSLFLPEVVNYAFYTHTA